MSRARQSGDTVLRGSSSFGLADHADTVCADEPRLKIVIVGGRGVGKTAIVRRFIQDSFVDPALPSVGADVYMVHLHAFIAAALPIFLQFETSAPRRNHPLT